MFHKFLYACRNVVSHGSADRTLVHGAFNLNERNNLRTRLQDIGAFQNSTYAIYFSNDMNRLLNSLERELQPPQRSNNYQEFVWDAEFSYAVDLHLPKLILSLAAQLVQCHIPHFRPVFGQYRSGRRGMNFTIAYLANKDYSVCVSAVYAMGKLLEFHGCIGMAYFMWVAAMWRNLCRYK